MSSRLASLLLLGLFAAVTACDSHIGMWSGGPGSAPDTDQDGVADDVDRCPRTPLDAVVDDQGCSTDHDRDGVPAGADRCPGTEPGVAVDGRGCPVDLDGDGVVNDSDQCADTRPSTVVDGNGCHVDGRRDDDGDGVFNDADACPNTPSEDEVDDRGCSLADNLAALSDIHFELDSAQLQSDALAVLDGVVRRLERSPEASVRVVGYTDSTFTTAYNRDLSQRRADAVFEYLVDHGIASRRLEAVGRGEQHPIASNETARGRQRNRRVDFILDR